MISHRSGHDLGLHHLGLISPNNGLFWLVLCRQLESRVTISVFFGRKSRLVGHHVNRMIGCVWRCWKMTHDGARSYLKSCPNPSLYIARSKQYWFLCSNMKHTLKSDVNLIVEKYKTWGLILKKAGWDIVNEQFRYKKKRDSLLSQLSFLGKLFFFFFW